MSYTLQKAWAAADGLSDTSPDKVVSGSDFQTEFEAIQTEFNNKANLTSPSLGGTPLAPTATAGTDSTQIATTAFVTNLIKAIYPVGSLYTTTDSTIPSDASRLGFGTWEAFAEGEVLVGKAGSGTFDTAGATGGSETQGLTEAQLPSHTHTVSHTTDSDRLYGGSDGYRTKTNITGTSSDKVSGATGDGEEHNNLQPYVVVYMWKRTA